MTLEVDQGAVGDVRQVPAIERDDIAEMLGIVDIPLDAVAIRARMDRHAIIPVGEVVGEVAVVGHSVPRIGRRRRPNLP